MVSITSGPRPDPDSPQPRGPARVSTGGVRALSLPPSCPRYVKTTGNATVDHLSKYLALRIALERRQQQEAGEPGGPGGGTSDATAGPDGGGGEGGGAGGADGPEEPALPSLEGVSEKQYTIYIAPGGGAFTVSAPQGRGGGAHSRRPRPPHPSTLVCVSVSFLCLSFFPITLALPRLLFLCLPSPFGHSSSHLTIFSTSLFSLSSPFRNHCRH